MFAAHLRRRLHPRGAGGATGRDLHRSHPASAAAVRRVPTAYFLFTSSELGGLKDMLINCAYPLIERFPLMFFTSAVVLLIGYGPLVPRDGVHAGASRIGSKGRRRLGLGINGGVKVVRTVGQPWRPTTRPTRPTSRPGSGAHNRSTSRSRKPASAHPPAIAACAASRNGAHRARGRIGPRRPRAGTGRQAASRRSNRVAVPATVGPRAGVPPPTERRSGYERPERRRRPDDDQPRAEPHGTTEMA